MTWPKLSKQLDGPRHPGRCQGCGTEGPGLSRWREHDANDSPTPVVVVLCKRCEDERIEKHPRLYARLSENEPAPGSMGLCADCRHRDGTACAHPDLKANGGPGLMLTIPQPTRVHVCRSPRRLSGWLTIWPHEPRACAGREEAAVAEA